MELEDEIKRFKMELFRKLPFYGDVLMHLQFVEDKSIPTAATDGKCIYYNPRFLAGLVPGERNFVIMHEVFHVMLMHVSSRSKDKDPRIWNTAADLVVNNMLWNLKRDMNFRGIDFKKPSVGLFSNISDIDTVENIYEKIVADNRKMSKYSKSVMVRQNLNSEIGRWNQLTEHQIPDDLKDMNVEKALPGKGDNSTDSNLQNDRFVKELIMQAMKKSSGLGSSYYIPETFYKLVESRKINWKTLLRDYFTEQISDDASYTTPERKYLHMDLILPGHCLSEEQIEDVWAFVDSSGSVSTEEMNQFLTQLYRISKEFKCSFHIVYWDTDVTDEYHNITNEKDILKCVPKHSGGTDINCVYKWISVNKVKPDVMLILSDGYFGSVNKTTFIPSLRKKTILVLSPSGHATEEMKQIGKIAAL